MLNSFELKNYFINDDDYAYDKFKPQIFLIYKKHLNYNKFRAKNLIANMIAFNLFTYKNNYTIRLFFIVI